MDAMQIGGSPLSIDLGGCVVQFSPLTLGDIADFEAYILSQKIMQYRGAIGDNATSRDRLLVVDMASRDIDVPTAMGSMAGVRKLLWYSARRLQPELAEETLGNLITMANMGMMQKLIDMLAGKSEEPEGADSPPAPAPGPPSS